MDQDTRPRALPLAMLALLGAWLLLAMGPLGAVALPSDSGSFMARLDPATNALNITATDLLLTSVPGKFMDAKAACPHEAMTRQGQGKGCSRCEHHNTICNRR